MNFILGIFTGISIAILWGMYLNNQRKKEQEKRIETLGHAYKNFFAALDDEMSRWKGFKKPAAQQSKYLSRLLEDAIERDDFEEAARLRDLMNKK